MLQAGHGPIDADETTIEAGAVQGVDGALRVLLVLKLAERVPVRAARAAVGFDAEVADFSDCREEA